jgi:hypothetical protein
MTETPPPFGPDTLRLFTHEGVVFDQRDGWGAVPAVENVAYSGFVVLMRPSVFLALCPELEIPEGKLDRFRGQALSMGFLDLRETEFGIRIMGHEGRHRMAFLMARAGDVPMPVAVRPMDGMRARHVTRGFLERFRSGAWRERQQSDQPERRVRGPLFDHVVIMGREIDMSGNVPARRATPDRAGNVNWFGGSVAGPDGTVYTVRASVDPHAVERTGDGSVERADVRVTATFERAGAAGHPHGDDAVAEAVGSVLVCYGAEGRLKWASAPDQEHGVAVLKAEPSVVDVLWPELQPAAVALPSR